VWNVLIWWPNSLVNFFNNQKIKNRLEKEIYEFLNLLLNIKFSWISLYSSFNHIKYQAKHMKKRDKIENETNNCWMNHLMFNRNSFLTFIECETSFTNWRTLIWNPFYCVLQQDELTFTAYVSEELSVSQRNINCNLISFSLLLFSTLQRKNY
jgi:hypothetical protein